MSILVTGAAGQLGSELVRQLGAGAIARDASQLDITNLAKVAAEIGAIRPAVVINCAAYTGVDQAEQESAACYAVNATGVAHLAQACSQFDSILVQLSTDYVFGADALRQTPYRETDATGPQGTYACSKLAGEQNARSWRRHIVIRSCGLYGPAELGGNFVETILRLGRRGERLRVVDDQVCNPTYTAHLAAAIVRLIELERFGTYHVVNAGTTTWYEFAKEILSAAEIDVPLEAISTEQFAARAPRPRYSALDTSKYQQSTGQTMPAWQEALHNYLAQVPQ